MKRIGQDRDSNKSFVICISTWNFPGSSWWILETGQVFCLLENNDGSVVFKLDDHNCLTVLDGKLIMQEENKDKESLLIFIHFLIACWEVLNEIFSLEPVNPLVVVFHLPTFISISYFNGKVVRTLYKIQWDQIRSHQIINLLIWNLGYETQLVKQLWGYR